MEEKEHNGILYQIISNKKFLLVFILILALGIFVRIYKSSEVGYWSDDETTLPTGLLWFYPHDFYPGLLGQGEPALGNYIIAKGCMLSGEDFSGVTQMKPRFYPGREILIGTQLIKANNYCHLPMYLFSIIFFISAIYLSLLLLNKYGALLVTGLLGFNSFLLVFSRWIHVDVILYTFVVWGLIALLKALQAEKKSKTETVWWIVAVAMMALAFSIKIPAAIYIVFSSIVMAAKYRQELLGLAYKTSKALDLDIFKKEHEAYDSNRLFTLAFFAIAIIAFILYFTFEGFSNISAVIKAYQEQGADIGTLGLNKDALSNTLSFLLTFSTLEMLLIIATIIYLPFLIKRSLNGSLKEKLIASLAALFFVMLAITPSMKLERVYFLFAFGLLYGAGMMVDSIAENISASKKYILLAFLLLVFLISAFHAIYTAPDFITNYKSYNILSMPQKGGSAVSYGARWIGEYLEKTLSENETYFPADPMTMVTYYVRHDQQLKYFLYRENFKAQFGRSLTVEEYLANFKPNNQKVRYLLIDKNTQNQELFVRNILEQYEPNHIIYQPSIRKVETIRVYDLENLNKKI